MGQLAAAQFEIEAAIAELSRGNAPSLALTDARSQLAAVGAMRHQLAGADARSLIAMRDEIAAVVSSAQAAAQQARAAAVEETVSNLSNLAQSARAVVNDTMRGMKDFEPYLHFANAQEEADYRKREDERRAYIAAEQAKGTPESQLNASGAAVGQMADAAAHGAAQSPEFQQRWDKLTASTEALRAQLIREGKDVSEFDKRLREDLRTIMRSKGMSDAKIDALFAAHRDNPLDAAKAFVAEQRGAISEQEITNLEAKAVAYKAMSVSDSPSEPRPIATPDPASPMVDAMAKLKASGVAATTTNDMSEPTHGVSAQAVTRSTPSRSI